VTRADALDDRRAPLIALATTTSTQEHARCLLQDGAAHGTVVVAREQTAGRGRRGRSWLSGPHGLWLSLVVRGALPMARAPRLPLVAADAVASVLVARGVDCRVKWPNDLLVPDAMASSVLGPFRKVGGLLLEAVDVGPADAVDVALRGAVLGLGINLRAPRGGFPPEIATTAGALADVVAAFDVDDAALDTLRHELAVALQTALSRALPAGADEDAFAATRARLVARSATLGRRVHVDGHSGVAVDLDGDGALRVHDDDGVVHTIFAGDVAVAGPVPGGAHDP
jgi:BirA family biotin operon repressor/biotin-[acetyl-CoA-carboxylase] ligase